MTTTLDALYVAKYAALTGDGALAALVGSRVYDSIAPDGATFDYIVLGGTGEGDGSSYDSAGGDTVATDHIWTRAPDDQRADRASVHAIWGHVRRIYNAMSVVGGYRIAYAEARLIEVLVDPTDRQVIHGVIRHRVALEVP